ncbi:DUF1761 domain-containing protein [Novosphingobium sp. M1R2S20]|uniref:DUF1761 domain-containing protein n=1 Tax=Novosphingobium rhizovicinum TaxID=3228928 RepID=A0ABV3R8N2_9SPHN
MGPVNWLAVILAAALAVAVGLVWNGPLFRSGRPLLGGAQTAGGKLWLPALVFLLSAIMLGHNFARIGAETLAFKPWLYFMQTGGTALFFVLPAVWLTHARTGTEPTKRLLDCGFWLAAYLAMGVVFWALG